VAAKPRWGYHRLDSRWAERLVASAQVRQGDLVLDVGAGVGALTAPLVACGARVVAVELHQGRASELRGAFRVDQVTVVVADATDLRLPRRPFRVVANPPFAVTTALLRRLTAPGSRLVRADLVVPWHAAERWACGAAPGAQRWERDFHAWVACRLPRAAFRPAAPSGTAVLVLRRRGAAR
jgi:23S rRNA (adenine-N6)-dimethyltransferase